MVLSSYSVWDHEMVVFMGFRTKFASVMSEIFYPFTLSQLSDLYFFILSAMVSHLIFYCFWKKYIFLLLGVGFRVGGETGSRYFVLQVHYGDIGAFRGMHFGNLLCKLYQLQHQKYLPVENNFSISAICEDQWAYL